jgi:hypothetical protein
MSKHHRGGETAANERRQRVDEAHRHGHSASEEGASTGADKQAGGPDRSHHGDKRTKTDH